MSKSKIIFILACFVYAISVVYNNGYYYFDEHYQLIEFAELKSGNNTPSDMAWEYGAEIRSALQPTLAFFLLSILRLIGITDHYTLMLFFRLFTAIITLLVLRYYIKKTEHLVIEPLRIYYECLQYFLWFLPFINIRFSSESYAGFAFLLGITLVYTDLRQKYFIIGCLISISFLFRFQTAFMGLGLVTWLISVKKICQEDFLKLLTGALTVIFLGIGIDYWFYNNLTITALNYFIINIVSNTASGFGVSPWHFYFSGFVKSAVLPLGIFIYVCLLFQLVLNWRSFLPWIIFPFLAIHILIPHKELRFLFPLANFIPLAIICTVQFISQTVAWQKKSIQRISKIVISILVTINFVALGVVIFSPADEIGRMNITQKIHDNYHKRKIKLWLLNTANPYKPVTPNQNFYIDTNVDTRPFAIVPASFARANTNLVLLNSTDISSYDFLLGNYILRKIQAGVPDQITYLRGLFGFNNNSLVLFEIIPKKSNGS